MFDQPRRSAGNATVAVLVGALIIGAALVGSSYMISRSLETMRGSLDQVKVAVEKAAAARPAQAQAPRRGPDPEKRYTIATEGAPSRGATKPKVTLVELSDFQCPFCGRVNPTLDQLLTAYPDTLQIVFKHLPLDFHTKAPAAHAAAEAAHRQGKFWEMYDKIFSNQPEMSPEKYDIYAAEIGLNVEQFKKDIASQSVKDRIDADKREAAGLGVTGTPSFFINGRYLSGALPVEQFKASIDQEIGRPAGG